MPLAVKNCQIFQPSNMPAGKKTSILSRHIIIGAIFVVMALVVTVFNTLLKKQTTEPPSIRESTKIKKTVASETASPLRHPQKLRIRSKSSQDNLPIVHSLENMLSQENFPGILNQLEKLSDSRSLNSIENLLKYWCRSDTGDLAQWCLAYSKESDPKLHLRLCAEALTNPNQQLRETSAAELEVISGVSFSNTAEARSWLESTERK